MPAEKAPAPVVPPVDPGWFQAWTRLAGAVLATAASADRSKIDWSITVPIRVQAEQQRVRAQFVDAIAQGAELERAVLTTVEEHARRKEWELAWSLAEGAGRLPGGQRAGALGHALLLHRRRQFDRCLPILAELADTDLASYLPLVAVDAYLAEGGAANRERACRIAAVPVDQPAAVLVDLAGRLLAFGEWELSASLVARIDDRRAEDIAALDERHRRSLQLVRGWLARTPKTVPANSVPVGVIDYQSPDQDLTSGNLGDYIQTLAMVSHLVRRQDVRFTGENGLGELAADLQDRVRPDLRTNGDGADVHLLDINREFTSGDDLPDGTWMIAFGWHMHPLYDLRYDFPYHSAVRPIFVSFHLNRLAMLTDEALQYLRDYGPVGCRDWSTVFLLLSAGVDAFFSGCLTTTVDGVFPAREKVFRTRGVVGAIDIPASTVDGQGKPVQVISHQSDDYRHMDISDGIRAAFDALSRYQREFATAVTNRLHAYLPLVSLNVPTEFRTKSPGDVRFNGLIGLEPGDPALDEIQHNLRSLLSSVFDLIFSGAQQDDVYAHWRAITAEHVAAARAAYEQPTAMSDSPVSSLDVEEAVSVARSGQQQFAGSDTTAEAVDVVLSYDQNLATQAAVLVESMLKAASGPLRLTVLGRGLGVGHGEWLAECFPDLPITIFPCDHVDYGPVQRIPRRITVSTMDRLLLPLLLKDTAQCIYLDVDTIVLDDICELARTELGTGPFAARDSNLPAAAEIRSAVRRLPRDEALEIQRTLYRRLQWGSAALNAGVLVLNLARMRADDFTRRGLGWVERYGFHDQDVMLAYGGTQRLALAPRWNALPVHEDVENPAIIHWAAMAKPWDPELTFAQKEWQSFAASLANRGS